MEKTIKEAVRVLLNDEQIRQQSTDVVLESIKDQFSMGVLAACRSSYGLLFDDMIGTLRSQGCYYDTILDVLHEQRDTVLENALGMNMSKASLPFLSVVPVPFLGLYPSVSLISLNERKGYTNLNPYMIKDRGNVKVKKYPYFIYDIQILEKDFFCDLPMGTLKNAREFLLAQDDHLRLTTEETLAVAMFTRKFPLYFTSSYYDTNDRILFVCIDGDGYPRLDWISESNESWFKGEFYFATCGSRD